MKKGFTLVELLAVIVILGIVAAITIPRIQDSLNDSRESAYNLVVSRIEDKAQDYVNNSNLESQITAGHSLDVYLSTLINQGYIETKDLEDPRNSGNSIDQSSSFVRFTLDNGNVKYDHCFIVIDANGNRVPSSSDELPSTDITAPVITITGSNNVVINQGSTYTDAGATATDDVEGDITNRIITTGAVNPNIAGSYNITYMVSDNSGNSTSATRTVIVFAYVTTYAYTGSPQTFAVPYSGNYKIELWGASGGTSGSIYPDTIGKGGYTKGTIYLDLNTTLYVNVGGAGQNFNGGGRGEAPGGGATDIRLTSGAWNDLASLRSRIMVAGGGGGGVYSGCGSYVGTSPGNSGGLSGQSANFNSCSYGYGYSGYGGTQTTGGAGGQSGYINGVPGGFGYGGESYFSTNSSYSSSGGGGGYYGGGSGTHPGGTWTGGGGGSSFISGYSGCNAIDSNGSPTGQPNHYSGKVFTNGVMLNGSTSMSSPSGSTETGHAGNGYARITYLP